MEILRCRLFLFLFPFLCLCRLHPKTTSLIHFKRSFRHKQISPFPLSRLSEAMLTCTIWPKWRLKQEIHLMDQWIQSIKYIIGNQIACHGKKTNNQNMINRPTEKSPCKSQHQTSTDVNLQGASAILVAIIFQRCIHSLRCDRNPMLSNHSAQNKAYQGKVPA